MIQEPTDIVTIGDRPLRLSRPVLPHAARRLEAILPQIAALNAAGKSQADAAAALDTTVNTLRAWLDITGTTWVNLNRRGPYKKRA
jgi:hypothetical protein